MTALAEIDYEEGVTEIPDVPCYVVALDTLYSGWGPPGRRAGVARRAP